MRTRSLFGALLATAALATPSFVDAQSFTEVSDRLAGGVFDGFGIGLANRPHDAEHRWEGAVVTVRGGGHRAVRAYDRDDSCWDAAWDLRWDDGFYGWNDDYGSYDHLDFYHDCLRGGIDFAYDQWRWHGRRGYGYGYGYPRTTIALYLFVRDPLWHPRGPYFAYDPWGWSGGNFGARNHVRGWGRSPTVVAVARRSPLGEPRFKEDPRAGRSRRGGRTAMPRPGSAQAPSAPSGADRESGPSAAAPNARRRPSDGLGGGETARPSSGDERAPTAAEPSRPSDAARGGQDRDRAAPPRATRERGAVEAQRSKTAHRGEGAPRSSERRGGNERPAPKRSGDR